MATTGGQSFWLNDRRVIVRTGTKSQTVNVCTPENAPGEYEAVYHRHNPPAQQPLAGEPSPQ